MPLEDRLRDTDRERDLENYLFFRLLTRVK
jgi:hypothetical protein